MTDLNSPSTNRQSSLLVLVFTCLALVLLLTAYLVYARNSQSENQVANQQSQTTTTNQNSSNQTEEETNQAKNDSTSNQDKSPNVNTHVLTYESKGKIYFHNLETKQTKELSLIDQFAEQDISAPDFKTREPIWSPDGKYLAYKDRNNNLALYQTDMDNNRLLKSFTGKSDGDQISYSILSWSPNSRYLIINIGTGPGIRSMEIIDAVSDKLIGSYPIINSLGSWSKDGSQYSYTKGKELGFSRDSNTEGSELTSDLALLTFDPSGAEEIISKTGNELTAYQAYGWTEDGKVRYIKNLYQSKTSPEYSSSYWIYKENGQDEEISEDKDFQYNQEKEDIELPKNLVPDSLYDHAARHSEDRQWVVFVTRYPQKVYIMKDKQLDSAEFISDGDNPSWQPF